MHGIHYRKISKAFGDHEVLKAVDLTIAPRTSCVLIGLSGSGKSLLMKCALGLTEADEGDVWIDGASVQQETLRQRENRFSKTGVVFQSSALFDSMTVMENIAFRVLMSHSSAAAYAMAAKIMDLVGLARTTQDLYPSEISGGMKRRVSIARAIVLKPKYLFFDEPTAGLDPIASTYISQLIRHCVADLRATALTITHDIASLRLIGDTVAMLYDKAIVWSGSLQAMDATDNPLIYQFIHGQVSGPAALS